MSVVVHVPYMIAVYFLFARIVAYFVFAPNFHVHVFYILLENSGLGVALGDVDHYDFLVMCLLLNIRYDGIARLTMLLIF